MTTLKAENRLIVGKKVKELRRAGMIPAVLYGHKIKNQNLAVDAKEFKHIFKEIGETGILELLVGGKKHKVLIHDVAYHPLSRDLLHIDFYEVRMDEKIRAKVPLVFVGESPAVKNEKGTLVKSLQEVEVEALPQDLPKEIEIDISILATFDDKIHISDLKIKKEVKILMDAQDIVASVIPPRSEEELKELESAPVAEVGEVKVVGQEEKSIESGPEEKSEGKTE